MNKLEFTTAAKFPSAVPVSVQCVRGRRAAVAPGGMSMWGKNKKFGRRRPKIVLFSICPDSDYPGFFLPSLCAGKCDFKVFRKTLLPFEDMMSQQRNVDRMADGRKDEQKKEVK